MKEAFLSGDYKKSTELARLELDDDPTNVDALHVMSCSLQQQHLFEEAIEYGLREVMCGAGALSELVQARNYVNLADMYFSCKQHEKGYRWLQKGYVILRKLQLESTPHFFHFWIATGRMYRCKGQWQEALNSVNQAILLIPKRDPKYDSLYCGALTDKGHAYTMLKNDKEALFCYMEAREKCKGRQSPLYANTCLSLAKLYFVNCHYRAALPLFVECLALFEQFLGPSHARVEEVELLTKKCYLLIEPAKPQVVRWEICKGNGSQCRECRRYFAVLDKGLCDSCLY